MDSNFRFLLNLDFLGPEFNLRFNKRPRIQTWFGIFTSMGYLASTISFTVLITMSFFDRKSPVVIISNSANTQNHKINFQDNSLLPVFFLVDENMTFINPKDAPSYFNLEFLKERYRRIDSQAKTPLNSGAIAVEKYKMPVVPCSELAKNSTAFESYRRFQSDALFVSRVLDFGLCIWVDPEEATTSGELFDEQYEVLKFQALPCNLKTGCRGNKEIQKVGISSAVPYSSVNLSNFETPMDRHLKMGNVYLTHGGTRQRYQHSIIQTDIIDNRDSFESILGRKATTNISVFSYDHDIAINSLMTRNNQSECAEGAAAKRDKKNPKACLSFLSIEYTSSNKTIRITRLYKTVMRTLSEIGGLNSILFLLFYYLTKFYAHFAEKRLLSKEVFGEFLHLLDHESCSSQTAHKRQLLQAKEKARKQESAAQGLQPPQTDVAPGAFFANHLDNRTVEKMKRDAYKMIEDTIDVVTIVREIISMKVLLSMLFDDHLSLLGPLALFGLRSRGSGQAHGDPLSHQTSPRKAPPYPNRSSGFLDGALSQTGRGASSLNANIPESVEQLTRKCEELRSRAPAEENREVCFEARANEFVLNSLKTLRNQRSSAQDEVHSQNHQPTQGCAESEADFVSDRNANSALDTRKKVSVVAASNKSSLSSMLGFDLGRIRPISPQKFSTPKTFARNEPYIAASPSPGSSTKPRAYIMWKRETYLPVVTQQSIHRRDDAGKRSLKANPEARNVAPRSPARH